MTVSIRASTLFGRNMPPVLNFHRLSSAATHLSLSLD